MSKNRTPATSSDKQKKEGGPFTPPASAAPPGSTSVMGSIFSGTFRQAKVMRKHVHKLLNHQRDILPAQDVAAINAALSDLDPALAARTDEATVENAMENLGNTAEKRLKPYPNASYRENVEVLLVALAVAMGIRTFFLQPFKIPTGSMQPTLYGVTSIPDVYGRQGQDEGPIDPAKLERPKGWAGVADWFAGVSYLDIKAKVDGELEIEKPVKFLIFNLYQSIKIGGISHSIWFPPDYGGSSLEGRAGLHQHQYFKEGEQVVKMRIVNGDHLFVDRLTYNFRSPQRGEIIVFETKGIPADYRINWRIPPDQFYIKRLVGLGGERIQIGVDRHLRINDQRLDSSTRHFEKVYGFDPKDPPRESQYSGHVLSYHSDTMDIRSPFFEGKPDGVEIPPSHYMVMGDNTVNSLDSRYWGYFPSTAVIGRAFFVYWPLTERFGWGYHR